MTAALVRVRLKGTRVYLLPPSRPAIADDLLSAAKVASNRPLVAWALVTFYECEGKHGSDCRYDWPISAGPIHLMPAAVAERLREMMLG